METCPFCSDDLVYDEVDIGVGTMRGPEGCSSCGFHVADRGYHPGDVYASPAGMRHTWVSTTFSKNIHEFRAVVAALLPGLKWRRHGIGVLQAYVREATDNEVRIHIWHPDIVRPGIVDHGDAHDHRFWLRSLVLHGGIKHAEFELTRDDSAGEWKMYDVTHARADLGARYQPLNDYRYRATIYQNRIGCGSSYVFASGCFHRTRVDALAVTVMTKTNQHDVRARILSRFDSPVVHAFEEGDDDFDMQPFIEMAQKVLVRG